MDEMTGDSSSRHCGVVYVPKKYADFMYRRTKPLLHVSMLQTRTIEHLLAEAYRLGLADAAEVLSAKDEREQNDT